MCSFEGIILDSSAVEHSAVNRRVVGSNPTRGAKELKFLIRRQHVYGFFCNCKLKILEYIPVFMFYLLRRGTMAIKISDIIFGKNDAHNEL